MGMPKRAARRLRRTALASLSRAFSARGYELIRRDFYSPLPDVERLASTHWDEPIRMPGIVFDVEAQFRFLESDLVPFLSEFQPPRERTGGGFYLDNETYGSVDAESLYGILRRLKPGRVVELGSGSSTHVIHAALAKNREEDAEGEQVAYDPFPWTATDLDPLRDVTVVARRAEDVTAADLADLRAGDVLFVDTTHTVKAGGDVTRIVLELLPNVAEGVFVHFHDIFLPWEYPKAWIVDEHRLWAEQYLLQAFLIFNRQFRVVLGAHALARADGDRLRRSIPSFGPRVAPGAFWIERTPV